MSGRAYYGPNPRSYNYVPGVGEVRTGPSRQRNRSSMSDIEEGETRSSSSGSQFWHPGTPSSARANQHSSHSRESSCRAKRYSPHTRRPGNSEARTWSSWDSSGSHEWHEANNRNESRHASRSRESDEYYQSSRRRSRSRSPERVTYDNGNVFSRRGHIFANPNDRTYQRRASALAEIPPYIASEPKPPEDCQCSISWRCRHRPDEVPDCRPLVPREKAWAAKQKQQVEVVELAARGLARDDLINIVKLNKLARDLGKLTYGARARNERIFEQIRCWITEVQECAFVLTQEILDASRVLVTLKEFLSEDNKDLRATAKFPIDFEEDLGYVMRKWTNGELGNHPDRGFIKEIKSSGRVALRLDKTWAHYQSANHFGAGDLVNGQRWKKRVHMIPHGVHGAPIAGIWGHSVQEGCQALVMGRHGQGDGGYYADRDKGEQVWYITTARRKKEECEGLEGAEDGGEDAKDEDVGPTNHTKMLLKSIETQKPIRLIRSDKLPDINIFRPAQGYRYDGLYKAVGSELLKEERQIYRVKLVRLPGQGPIRINDQRTFDETPEELARAARQKESARRSRESARAYL